MDWRKETGEDITCTAIVQLGADEHKSQSHSTSVHEVKATVYGN